MTIHKQSLASRQEAMRQRRLLVKHRLMPIMQQRKAITFSVEHLPAQMPAIAVYMFMYRHIPIYVGRTTNGIGHLWDPDRVPAKLGRWATRLIVVPCRDEEEAKQLEQETHEKYTPSYKRLRLYKVGACPAGKRFCNLMINIEVEVLRLGDSKTQAVCQLASGEIREIPVSALLDKKLWELIGGQHSKYCFCTLEP